MNDIKNEILDLLLIRNVKINILYKKYGGMRCFGKLMGIKVNFN